MKKKCTLCFPVRGDKLYLPKKLRGFGEGFLNGYGGKWDRMDKTIVGCAIRELKQESGVAVRSEDLEKVAIIDFFKGGEPLFECHVFVVRNWEGEFAASEEMGAPETFDLKALPFDKMWDADKVWLPLIFTKDGIKRIRAWSYYSADMKRQIDFKYQSLEI